VGWRNQEVFEYYLWWLKERVDGSRVLLWDVDAAHCHNDVKKLAKLLCIELRFRAAGT
jgi:hypothetical protein